MGDAPRHASIAQNGSSRAHGISGSVRPNAARPLIENEGISSDENHEPHESPATISISYGQHDLNNAGICAHRSELGVIVRITNVANLPQSVVSAISNDPYVKVGDVSVTSLAKSPRQYWLGLRHSHEVVEDATERIWSLFGQLGHGLFERANTDNHLSEERLTTPVNGWVLSGQPDLLSPDGVLDDFKFTSTWAVKDEKPEWTQQLNTYGFLYTKYGFNVTALRIVAILRDWSKRRSQRENDYPPVGVVVREVPLWSIDKQWDYILSRVKLLQDTENTPDNDLPHCTPEERWATPEVWAVKKKGAKRALRLFDIENMAALFINDYEGDKEKLEIEHRPGENVKCQSYCSVQKFCNFYQNELKPNASTKANKEERQCQSVNSQN